jgi:hypothetical protein
MKRTKAGLAGGSVKRVVVVRVTAVSPGVCTAPSTKSIAHAESQPACCSALCRLQTVRAASYGVAGVPCSSRMHNLACRGGDSVVVRLLTSTIDAAVFR